MPCANCKAKACFTGSGEMPADCPERRREEFKSGEPQSKLMEYAADIRAKEINRLDELTEYADFMVLSDEKSMLFLATVTTPRKRPGLARRA